MRSHSLLGLTFARKLTRPPVGQTITKNNVPAITVGLVYRCGDGPAATVSTSAEAGYSCGGCERRVSNRSGKLKTTSRAGPLDPHEVKAARQKEIQYLWDMEVYACSIEAESRTPTGRNPVGLEWIDTNKGSAEAPRYRSRFGGAPQRGRTDLLGNTSRGNSSSSTLCCQSGRRFSRRRPFLDLHR